MKKLKEKARKLLKEFKRNNYIFGLGCLEKISELAAPYKKRIALVTDLDRYNVEGLGAILYHLTDENLRKIVLIAAAQPNAPREDVIRIKKEIRRVQPDSIIVAAGGSGIDSVKAANVLLVLGGDIEDYFGTGKVTEKLQATNKKLIPLIAIQTAASSGAHLTKYSNITNLKTGQKKLIVDQAIVPTKALFDYKLTTTMPRNFTCDGAFDGIAHCLEVFYGARSENYKKISEIAKTGIELVLAAIEKVVVNGKDLNAREALGLATDLGGYAIMIGGTNGGHLTSFSLVDILSHGRACAIMNPYYTVFFASAIEDQLKEVGAIYAKYGLIKKKDLTLKGRNLGIAVAQGMIELSKKVGFPTTLNEVPGMSDEHIERALKAAKNPQLKMKLQNMPIPLTADMIDKYMKPILEAARTGNFDLIKNI